MRTVGVLAYQQVFFMSEHATDWHIFNWREIGKYYFSNANKIKESKTRYRIHDTTSEPYLLQTCQTDSHENNVSSDCALDFYASLLTPLFIPTRNKLSTQPKSMNKQEFFVSFEFAFRDPTEYITDFRKTLVILVKIVSFSLGQFTNKWK